MSSFCLPLSLSFPDCKGTCAEGALQRLLPSRVEWPGRQPCLGSSRRQGEGSGGRAQLSSSVHNLEGSVQRPKTDFLLKKGRRPNVPTGRISHLLPVRSSWITVTSWPWTQLGRPLTAKLAVWVWSWGNRCQGWWRQRLTLSALPCPESLAEREAQDHLFSRGFIWPSSRDARPRGGAGTRPRLCVSVPAWRQRGEGGLSPPHWHADLRTCHHRLTPLPFRPQEQ